MQRSKLAMVPDPVCCDLIGSMRLRSAHPLARPGVGLVVPPVVTYEFAPGRVGSTVKVALRVLWLAALALTWIPGER